MNSDFRDRIREIYNAYLEGHFEFLLDEVVHDEIEFVSDAPTHAFPYFARRKGKVALLAAWKAFRVDYEFLSYVPLIVVTENADAVVVVVKMKVKALATNRAMELIVADFLRFRDDRVIEFRQFMNSLDATELWLARKIDDSKS